MSCQWAGYLESSRRISEKERKSYKDSEDQIKAEMLGFHSVHYPNNHWSWQIFLPLAQQFQTAYEIC